MKKMLLLVLFTTAISLHAMSQEYTKPQLSRGVHPGTITTLDGQTVKGYIYYDDRQANQKKCIYYTDFNDVHTEKVYKPADIAGYTIENMQYKSINYSGNIGFGKGNRNFVYITQPGAITTFTYWAPTEQLLWQKGDEEPFSNASMVFGFKKTMLNLVGDDVELAGKVDRKDKGYGILGVATIVNEYNAWAASKK
ncbi:hypothetical protein [Mucilaginibacter sp.]|uniref:hypothetical protein n=1 Tax=Mucilaginibacter sp. TaxID=1882438 RepID=UPI002617C51F|nr:hypothetical protein [Mucilaginibacter sp.]MDB5030062.1 hypothetical protein [Mucilaginibacter sp.]